MAKMNGAELTPDNNLPLNTDWAQRARCTEYAGKVDFFPRTGESAKEAKAICNLCEVKVQCLEYALQFPAMPGVWGGTSMRERRAIRHDRNRSDHTAATA